MREPAKPRYTWFRIPIIFGMLLGLVLLGQTLATYRYVSANLVRQEALREAERKLGTLRVSVRLTGTHDAARLAPVLEELRRESPQIAWVRILTVNGDVLAASGRASTRPYAAQDLRQMLREREHRVAARETADGMVLVTILPLWVGPPPDGVFAAEFAIDPGRVSEPFGRLRQNAVVGCLAAIALVASMILIGLRFGPYMRGKQYEQQLELARHVQRDLLPSAAHFPRTWSLRRNAGQPGRWEGIFTTRFEWKMAGSPSCWGMFREKDCQPHY